VSTESQVLGLVGETFGSLVTVSPSRQAMAPLDMMERYVDTLWGQRKGYAALAFGWGGRFGASGKYEFKSFEPLFFVWPDQRDRLLATSWRRAVGGGDVYCCPMLRATPVRRKNNAIGGRHLWADVDRQLTSAEVRQWLRPGSFVVASGRGAHVYVDLGQVEQASRIEELNRRLAKALDADHKWSNEALLRLPGTFSHKGRPTGGGPVLVTIREWA
jgi:hypothetical protein